MIFNMLLSISGIFYLSRDVGAGLKPAPIFVYIFTQNVTHFTPHPHPIHALPQGERGIFVSLSPKGERVLIYFPSLDGRGLREGD